MLFGTFSTLDMRVQIGFDDDNNDYNQLLEYAIV